MLDLQPLIARFVDDVLRTIRTASLDELRALLGEAATRAPALDKPRDPPRGITREPARAARSAPSRGRRRAQARPRPLPVAPPSAGPGSLGGEEWPRATRTGPAEAPEPPAPAEITDPEALLAAASAWQPVAPSPPPTLRAVDGDVELAAPPSGERSARGVARLRAGETLAREAGTGVVIRRAKRA
jgi:hypothetical protein